MESKLKKKVATAAAGVAVVGAAVSLTAGTFSYFTDTTGNDAGVQAGNLHVGATLDQPFNLQDVAPGQNFTRTVTVTNGGSVSGYLTFQVIHKGSSQALQDALQVRFEGITDWMSLTDMEARGAIHTTIQVQRGQSTDIKFDVAVPDSGNQNYLQDKQVQALLATTLDSSPQ